MPEESTQGQEFTKKEKKIATIVLFLIVAVPILLLSSFKAVRAGTVKVVTRFGGTTGRTLEPGANVIIPFVEGTRTLSTKFMLYETMREKDIKNSQSDYKETAVDTNTNDGQKVDVYYTVRFAIDSSKAVWVINKFGSEAVLVDKMVRAESRSKARTIASNFSADELYVGEGREKLAKLIFEAMHSKLNENGIMLDDVLVREVEFDDDYIKAIETKQIEAVKVETEKNIASQAAYRKQARITEAEGKAREQELQRETLSAQVLQKTELDVKQTMADALKISAEKGQKIVPNVVLGEDQSMLYQLPTGE